MPSPESVRNRFIYQHNMEHRQKNTPITTLYALKDKNHDETLSVWDVLNDENIQREFNFTKSDIIETEISCKDLTDTKLFQYSIQANPTKREDFTRFLLNLQDILTSNVSRRLEKEAKNHIQEVGNEPTYKIFCLKENLSAQNGTPIKTLIADSQFDEKITINESELTVRITTKEVKESCLSDTTYDKRLREIYYLYPTLNILIVNGDDSIKEKYHYQIQDNKLSNEIYNLARKIVSRHQRELQDTVISNSQYHENPPKAAARAILGLLQWKVARKNTTSKAPVNDGFRQIKSETELLYTLADWLFVNFDEDALKTEFCNGTNDIGYRLVTEMIKENIFTENNLVIDCNTKKLNTFLQNFSEKNNLNLPPTSMSSSSGARSRAGSIRHKAKQQDPEQMKKLLAAKYTKMNKHQRWSLTSGVSVMSDTSQKMQLRILKVLEDAETKRSKPKSITAGSSHRRTQSISEKPSAKNHKRTGSMSLSVKTPPTAPPRTNPGNTGMFKQTGASSPTTSSSTKPSQYKPS